MSREATVSATQMVARSLRISRPTHVLMTSLSAGVAVNAAVAMRFLGVGGQLVLLAVVFATLAVGASAVSTDVYSRSGGALSNLPSMGAPCKGGSSAVVLSLLG